MSTRGQVKWRKPWVARMKMWWGVSRVSDLPSPVVLWRGPSRLDPGVEIMVAACSAGPAVSKNVKTGDMVQVAVFRTDLPPVQAWEEGKDDAVCPESCIHRSKARGGQNSCYVNKGRLLSTWRAAREREALPSCLLPFWARGAMLRFGMEGDPSAAPYHVWHLLSLTALGWSGYTADWRKLDPRWADLFMASCASPAEADEAESLGWRTFSTSRAPSEDVVHAEAGRRVCHAESVGLTCTQCRGCNGLVKGAQRPSFHLPLHGPVGSAIRRRSGQVDLFPGV